MNGPVLLDTGPLVALLNRRDQYHAWAREQFDKLTTPLFTCEAVLSEACFLLRSLPGGVAAVIALWERGLVRSPYRVSDNLPAVQKLLARYANIPMSLADACLVQMAESQPGARVFTLDSDFQVYRMHRRQAVPLIFPQRPDSLRPR